MHEFSQKLHGRHLKLDANRIIDPETSEVVFDLKENRASWPLTVKQSLEYYQADKKLGALSSPVLEDVAERNLAFIAASDTLHLSDQDRSEMYELAGSALIEASFSAAQEAHPAEFQDGIEGRLEAIEAGLEALRQARDALGSDRTTTLHQRLQLKIDFADVYRDLACGELSSLTVEEIRSKLESHLYGTINNVDARHARGLGGEIRTLLHYWNNYENPGDEFAIPATVRGDTGYFDWNDTHDLDILHQTTEGRWAIVPHVEVKRRRITEAMRRRYRSSRLVHVNTVGTVRTVQEPRAHRSI